MTLHRSASKGEQLQSVEQLREERDQPEALQLTRHAGNRALGRSLSASDAGLLRGGNRHLGRWPVPVASPPPAQDAPPQSYQVGPNSYREDQYAVAVNQVSDLWTASNGIIAKQKTAVSRFCGPGGAGAAGEDDTFMESAIEGIAMAVLAFATDGISLAVGAAAEKGIGKLIGLLPKTVDKEMAEKASKVVLDKAVEHGKELAKKAVEESMKKAPVTVTPGGYRKLATPLATYQASLEDGIDAAGSGEKALSVQALLELQSLPFPQVKWVVASALYDGLLETLNAVDEIQWSVTSDRWFSMQMASGRGESSPHDVGRVLIDLKDDSRPDGARVRIAYCYLHGVGANDATLEPYNHRPMEEIKMTKLINMDNGTMGSGLRSWEECSFKILIGEDNKIIDFKGTNRFGELWLAAKGVHAHDMDHDDRDFHYANSWHGAELVWEELKSLTAHFKSSGGPSPW